jgi:HK97 family phage major capsid protein
MSYSPQAAREQRNALAKEVRNLLDNNPGATWKPEHQKQYDEKTQQIVALDEELTRHQRILDLEGDKLFADISGGTSVPGASADSPAAVRAYRAWLKGGDAAIKAAEFDSIRNTMSTTTGSEGGYTVPTEIAQSIADALKAYGGGRR